MNRRWPGPLLGAAAALAVASSAGTELGRRYDRRLFRLLNCDRGPAADAFFTGVTELGSIAASAAVAGVLATHGRRPRAAASALGAASATWLAGQAAKRLFQRPRPCDEPSGSRMLIARPNGSSWPSSHPAVLLAFVSVASGELKLSSAVRAALAGLAAVVGLSRVYVGVHYPSDVAGGLLMGSAVAGAWPSSAARLQ